jgi:hypothetical protein
MLPNSPWDGLGVSGIDSRRFDQFGKWNFFWAMMPKEDPSLALVLTALPEKLPKLPALRNLEAGFASLPSGPAFYIRLKDPAQLELFETLCRDIVTCAESAANEEEALEQVIARTSRWHYLLRGGRSSALAEEEQKGLIGELSILERLCTVLNPRAALTAWKGPFGAPKDFEMFGHCVEVKSRRAAAQPFLQISNEFQLSDVPDRRLWLTVLSVDAVASPFGETLHQIVARVARQFQADASNVTDWEHCLDASGYRAEDDYAGFLWVISDPTWHEVVAGFPRVDLPLRHGVANLRYTVAIRDCEPFAVDIEAAELALSQGYPHV